MYYPVMNVTQCEGQLSTYHLNGDSKTTPQSEEKKEEKKPKIHYNNYVTPRFKLNY